MESEPEKISLTPQQRWWIAAGVFILLLVSALLFLPFGSGPRNDPVRIACVSDYPPYFYMLDGVQTGSDYEIAVRIAEEAGRELELVPATFSELIPMVASDKVDMAICALTATEERRQSVVFSEPYEFSGQSFVVRAGENLHFFAEMIQRPRFRFGANIGSTGYRLLMKFLEGNQEETVKVVGFSGNRATVHALLDGKIDACVVNPMVARSFFLAHPGKLEAPTDLLDHEEFCVAVSRHEPGLLAAANRVIYRAWQSGEIYEWQEKHLQQSYALGHDDAQSSH